jgi:hypothetical protein
MWRKIDFGELPCARCVVELPGPATRRLPAGNMESKAMRKLLILTLLSTLLLPALGCGWHRRWAARPECCDPCGGASYGSGMYEGPLLPPAGVMPGPVYDGTAG